MTLGEVVANRGAGVVGGALGVAGAAFLPKYLKKLGSPLRGRFMSSVGLPLAGYAVGKLIASMIGK
jgi:hypothetical protein